MSAHVIVLGSRIYQPLTDIDRELAGLPSDAIVTAFGTSPVCERAVLAATSIGIEARNVALSSHRRELIEAAKRPSAVVLLFVAPDPDGSGTTEGMTQIGHLLAANDIAPRLVSSPLTGAVCAAITTLDEAVDRAITTIQERRRVVLVQRALDLATKTIAIRDRYEDRLARGLHLLIEDEAATERWLRWERCYRALSDAIEDARRVFAPPRGIAA